MIRRTHASNIWKLLPVVLILTVLTMSGRAAAETFRIEIDYMVEHTNTPHSHMPTPEEIEAVVQMFACQGHTLIVDVSNELEHFAFIPVDPTGVDRLFDYDVPSASFGRMKAENFDHAAEGNWHYCIFAHQYIWYNDDGTIFESTSSGLAEKPGDDLIVTLGNHDYGGLPTGSPFQKAATLAHEFGHNLGLSHCGDLECGKDDSLPDWVGPYAPNLPSIMSYYYQLTGVRSILVYKGLAPAFIPFKDLDYSHGTMCSLNENALEESLGTLMMPVDWNCNGAIGGTWPQDLNDNAFEGWCAGDLDQLTWLTDYDEWANIADPLKYLNAADLVHQEVSVCVSSDELEAYFGQPNFILTPLVTESCITSGMRYVRTFGSSPASGDCTDPFGSVGDAVAGAPDGSVILVEPGTWDEGPQVLDNESVLFSAGSAVIR